MLNIKFQYLASVFLVLVCSISIQAQLSKKHYLPPITSDDPIANQYIYISTPKDQNISFTIKPIGQPTSAEISGTVSNSTPFSTSATAVGIQLFQSSNTTSVVSNDRGYIIEADDVIYVSVRMRSQNGFQAGAIVSKGNSALGTDFRMGGFANDGQAGGYLNFISVMATENNTNVTFDDLPAGIVINNYTGTLPVNIILNEDETYIVSVSVNTGGTTNDLIGTLIKSDKPIVVNSGSATGSFHVGGGRDYGVDQIVDASKIGTEYIFVRGDGDDEWENALIIAHEDNTEVRINGGTVVSTINSGEYFVAEGNNYNANGNMFIATSKPTFAYQGIGGLNNGAPSLANQGMFFVPPLSCENRGDVNNIANIDAIGSDTFQGGVTIVTNKGATVTVNGSPITDFNTAGPFDVDGNTNYETYRVSDLNGNVAVKSSEELYCAYFNYDGFATSGSFYSGFPSAPEINFDNAPLYDKETFTVDIDDSNKNRLNTTLVRSNGVVSANAEVSITSELPYPPIRRGDLVANKDYRPPEATMAIWKNLQKEGCRAFRYTWGGDSPLIYLKDSKDLPELLQPKLGGFSNLSFLLGCSNWVLAGNGYMKAWLHLQTISQNYRSVKIGTDLIAEMKVNDVYAKKGHEFVDVAVDLYDEKDDECVMTINLIAIFKLRGM